MRPAVASVLVAVGCLAGGAVVPAAACSSMAQTLADVTVTAGVIVRAEVAAVRGHGADERYDLRVLDVLKGRAPAMIRGFDGSGEIRGGVCDEGWVGADVGDPVFLFLGTTSVDGTTYHARLQGRDWSRMDDGILARSVTAAGITGEIGALAPRQRALIPDALFLANAVEATRTERPDDITEAAVVVQLLHHTDGQLSFRAWRFGGRRVERFVIRAGDLATPGPVLFELAARNTEYEAWAVGAARDGFRRSAAAGTLRRALALVDAGQAVVEIWPRRANTPRFHGLIRPVALPTVTFSDRGQVMVRRAFPALVRTGVDALAAVPFLGQDVRVLVTRASRAW